MNQPPGAQSPSSSAQPLPDDAPIPRDEAYGPGLPEGMQPPRPEKPRVRQTVRDMVLTLLVVGGMVLFLYVMVLRPKPEPVRQVDVNAATVTAVQADALPIEVPTGLDSGWRATSARFTPGPEAGTGQWFLGYVTPDDRYVALAASDYDAKKFIDDQTVSGTPDGEQDVDGVTWKRYFAPGNGNVQDQRSLVRQQDGVTTVVTGTVSYDELATFIATLRTAN